MKITEKDKVAGMVHYFTGKLGVINYNMAVHEGDANRRLASQAEKIFLLPKDAVPEKYKKDYQELHDKIETTLDSIKIAGLSPYKIKGIRNSTASKFIKLLWLIEDELKDNEF